MRELLFSLPVICGAVLAVCWLGICLLVAKRDGGKLSRSDYLYTLRCGLWFVWIVLLILSWLISARYFPDNPYVAFALIVMAPKVISIILDKLLRRWVPYRKIRYFFCLVIDKYGFQRKYGDYR